MSTPKTPEGFTRELWSAFFGFSEGVAMVRARDGEVRAQALKEAADYFSAWRGASLNSNDVAGWLRARARDAEGKVEAALGPEGA